jgi:hypothetical protein
VIVAHLFSLHWDSFLPVPKLAMFSSNSNEDIIRQLRND